MKRNSNTVVHKGGAPEESALIANIESLLSELKGMGGAGDVGNGDPANPQFQPDELDNVDKGDSNFDGDEMGLDPEAKNRKDQDDGFAAVAKDIQATQHDGYDANGPAEDSIFEDIPDSDMDDLKGLSRQNLPGAVAKAQRRLAILQALAQKASVAKSQGSGLSNGDRLVLKALKDLQARQSRSDAIMAEILEGLGASQGVGTAPAAGRQVAKSNGRPEANYQGANAFMEQLADMIVQKSGGARNAPSQEQGLYGDPELDALLSDSATPTRNEVVQKSMRGFLGLFGDNASTWKS